MKIEALKVNAGRSAVQVREIIMYRKAMLSSGSCNEYFSLMRSTGPCLEILREALLLYHKLLRVQPQGSVHLRQRFGHNKVRQAWLAQPDFSITSRRPCETVSLHDSFIRAIFNWPRW